MVETAGYGGGDDKNSGITNSHPKNENKTNFLNFIKIQLLLFSQLYMNSPRTLQIYTCIL